MYPHATATCTSAVPTVTAKERNEDARRRPLWRERGRGWKEDDEVARRVSNGQPRRGERLNPTSPPVAVVNTALSATVSVGCLTRAFVRRAEDAKSKAVRERGEEVKAVREQLDESCRDFAIACTRQSRIQRIRRAERESTSWMTPDQRLDGLCRSAQFIRKQAIGFYTVSEANFTAAGGKRLHHRTVKDDEAQP